MYLYKLHYKKLASVLKISTNTFVFDIIIYNVSEQNFIFILFFLTITIKRKF